MQPIFARQSKTLRRSETSSATPSLHGLQKFEQKRDELLSTAMTAGSGRQQKLLDLRNQCKQLRQDIKDKKKEASQIKTELEKCPKGHRPVAVC